MIYVILGDPTPLARPRYGNNRIWDSQKKQKFDYQIQIQEQHRTKIFYNGPLLLNVTFYFQPPASYSKKRIERVLGTHHSSTPDASNLLKFIEDVSTGILYRDDALIAEVICKKVYSEVARTEFEITELGV